MVQAVAIFHGLVEQGCTREERGRCELMNAHKNKNEDTCSIGKGEIETNVGDLYLGIPCWESQRMRNTRKRESHGL